MFFNVGNLNGILSIVFLLMKSQNKPIRDTAKTLGGAKATICYVLKKWEHTGKLRNTERPGRPQERTVVDDRILSLVKNKTSDNRKSAIKRRLHQSNYRGFTTGTIGEYQKEVDHIKCQKSLQSSGTPSYGQMRQRSVCIRIMRRVWEKEWTGHDPKHTTSPVQHGGGSVMMWGTYIYIIFVTLYLLIIWLLTKTAWYILKSLGLTLSQMLQKALDSTSRCRWIKTWGILWKQQISNL